MHNLVFLQSSPGFIGNVWFIVIVAFVALILLSLILVLSWYKKVPQGKVLVRTGWGNLKVSFNGMIVFPVLHKLEIMDISLKSVEVARLGKDGLICKDNMRADIKVVFFVRVNPKDNSVAKVAQTIGVARASAQETLNQLFDAKFSEALKTVGKQFDFVELYNSRERFKQEILNVIGQDLNGYELDDAAIDYLEQTPIEFLKDDNILDSEGIKKIVDLTAKQHIEANQIRREEEKVITQQNVEAQEAILELNKQLAEKEEKQKREIAEIKAREEAQIMKVQAEEKLKSESARIRSEEEIAIAEENKQRQVIVASKSKERTDAVETERVEKDRQLEATERERIVTLAQIEKDKAVEEERKNIQDVIRERVVVEKAVVEEEEKIKDTRATAEAERNKIVAVTKAQEEAEAQLITQVKKAEAEKQAAEIAAKKKVVLAEADLTAAEKMAESKKRIADGVAAEEAAKGLAEANVLEAKAMAEAKGIDVRADAEEKAGLKEAKVLQEKMLAEAAGIEAQGNAKAKEIELKAEAMKKLDGVGKEHEEFKLRLEKETQIELAEINIQKEIAEAQAMVLAEGLKSANIDIVGGDNTFFQKIIGAMTQARQIDRLVDGSQVLSEVKTNLLDSGNGHDMIEKLKAAISKLGLSTEDIRNLSVAAAISKMSGMTDDASLQGILSNLLNAARNAGLADTPVGSLGILDSK